LSRTFFVFYSVDG